MRVPERTSWKNQREKSGLLFPFTHLHDFILLTHTLYPFKSIYKEDMDVAELTEAFKDQAAHPNHALLMQRVQELMGQGIDVSTFFATMVSVSHPFSSIRSILSFSVTWVTYCEQKKALQLTRLLASFPMIY